MVSKQTSLTLKDNCDFMRTLCFLSIVLLVFVININLWEFIGKMYVRDVKKLNIKKTK